MGRIKTRLVKRATHDLVDEHGEELTTDFDKNKSIVSEHLRIESKKLRNRIAGYATRIKKQKAEVQ